MSCIKIHRKKVNRSVFEKHFGFFANLSESSADQYVLFQETQEIIDTNSSIFLSKYYNKLSEVMSELGDLYANSEDISLEKLSNDYKAMKTDAKDFSKLVNKEWDQGVLR